MGKSAMRPSWMYKLGENIILIAKEENDLGVVVQDNLLPEKHIDRIFADTFRMPRIYLFICLAPVALVGFMEAFFFRWLSSAR